MDWNQRAWREEGREGELTEVWREKKDQKGEEAEEREYQEETREKDRRRGKYLEFIHEWSEKSFCNSKNVLVDKLYIYYVM